MVFLVCWLGRREALFLQDITRHKIFVAIEPAFLFQGSVGQTKKWCFSQIVLGNLRASPWVELCVFAGLFAHFLATDSIWKHRRHEAGSRLIFSRSSRLSEERPYYMFNRGVGGVA